MRNLALLVLVAVVATGCALGGPPPRADETDRIADVIALAIDSPRRDDAVGYARAAMDTRAARDGRLTVVAVSSTRLVLRVHLAAYDDQTVFGRDEPEVSTCYAVRVGVSGIGEPVRRPCPVGAALVNLPSPSPARVIPDGADAVVRAALRRTSGREALEEAVRRGLPKPAAHTLAPDVLVSADGDDIGVSVRGEDACLLGSRVDGEALVWRPSRVQVQPGELSCEPATALGRWGIDSPH